ncbi:MAG TPA: hypothetical protein VFT34_06765 [Verrucomicrobiae bacterium]|nr:hypothetical protein [Verrucomicrobiae bacterium]
MESRQNRALRVLSVPLAFFALVCFVWHAAAQAPDKFGPVMLSANVLEEEFWTNRIQITWNENLLVSSLSLPSFKVILAASNLPVAVLFGEYYAGDPTTTILRMSATNWHYRSNYYVIVNNCRDLANNVMAPNSIMGVTWPGRPTSPLPAGATPRLTITRSGANGLRVSWPTNAYSYALEWTTNVMRVGPNSVAGPWCEVQPLMANPYLTSPQGGTHRIYRLRKTQ